MANSLIINNSTVINSSLDFTGRNISSSGSVTVGSTTITSTSINVQNLTFGSISSSGGGFNINGAGTFTGALSAGSISTGGTFSAGNSVFNGTITLGSVLIQNGQYNVGSAYLNGSNLSVPGTVYAAGVAFGGNVPSGIYTDSTTIAVRAPSTNGGVYLQNPTGSTTWAIFHSGGGLINQNLNLKGTLTLDTGGSIQTDYAGNGGLRFINGGANQTGYIEFRTANTAQNRVGYIGFANIGSGAINVNAESGYYFNFTGNGGIPQIRGSNIISQSALNSALTNYITSSQMGGYLPLTGGSLSGTLNINEAPLIIGSNNNPPYLDLVYGGVLRARLQVDGSGNFIYRNGDSGQNYFYVSTNGAVWTAQLGDLNGRIEQRASDYANSVANSRVHGARFVYAGDLGNDWNYTGGFGSPYGGYACMVDRATLPEAGFGGQFVKVLRWRYLQMVTNNSGWFTVTAAS